jgi:hypothetical protein
MNQDIALDDYDLDGRPATAADDPLMPPQDRRLNHLDRTE